MQFRSMGDLSRTILNSMSVMPRDIDLVVGIPRSGLMAASLIATHMNLPLADLQGFCDGRLLQSGNTRRWRGLQINASSVSKVLVVDDSVRTGKSIGQAKEAISLHYPDLEAIYCAIYATSASRHQVDLALEIVALPRIFEWNALHNPTIQRSCVSMEGVICEAVEDVHFGEEDKYLEFLRSAKPRHVPTQHVGAILSMLPERYREVTVLWLGQLGITYDRLVMFDPETDAKEHADVCAKLKGTFYKNSNLELFVEGHRKQATQIAAISGKPVLCVDNGMRLVAPAHASLSGD
ncbi:hypothetical protein MUU53_22940 [Rhizobium lemnae]|uniref:Phosphoribosyltransferase family protein n=1 Tax=Rhizobium lemnae TaxID=1214924 RepID=A0ABV8EGD1_9HYPH|nr:phosphoribosyltransferase family protein [Rhizobium lemnae]MCJ8510701.1 hypothetical protein [Rhizobium lemnae]